MVLMWLDISPNNIFVSHIDGCHPVAKLGDLGNSRCFPQVMKIADLRSVAIEDSSSKTTSSMFTMQSA